MVDFSRGEFRFLFFLFLVFALGCIGASYLLIRSTNQMDSANDKSSHSLFDWSKDDISHVRTLATMLGVLGALAVLFMSGYSIKRKTSGGNGGGNGGGGAFTPSPLSDEPDLG